MTTQRELYRERGRLSRNLHRSLTKSKTDSLKEMEPRRFLVVERSGPAAAPARVPRRWREPLQRAGSRGTHRRTLVHRRAAADEGRTASPAGCLGRRRGRLRNASDGRSAGPDARACQRSPDTEPLGSGKLSALVGTGQRDQPRAALTIGRVGPPWRVRFCRLSTGDSPRDSRLQMSPPRRPSSSRSDSLSSLETPFSNKFLVTICAGGRIQVCDACPSPKRRPTVRLAREHPRPAAKTLIL
jgi:hypothetical protein